MPGMMAWSLPSLVRGLECRVRDIDAVEDLVAVHLILQGVGRDSVDRAVDGRIIGGDLDRRGQPRTNEGNVAPADARFDQQLVLQRHDLHQRTAGTRNGYHLGTRDR
ncbi:hypothetical protein AI27_12430 [Sphingomonas sp. BHC-A]|nr:hypothetical protein AI27_12430 [Sphingomonas sp. BHC-A]